MIISDLIDKFLIADKTRWKNFFLHFPSNAQIDVINVEKNSVIISEGAPANLVYVLLLGRLQMHAVQQNGCHYVLEKTEKNIIFGDLEAIMDDAEYYATLIAKTDCTIASFRKETYIQWLKSDAQISYKLMRIALGSVLYQLFSERANLFSNVHIRLINALIDGYETGIKCDNNTVLLKITRQNISDAVGCSTRTTARHLLALENDGLISRKARKYYINDKQYVKLNRYIDKYKNN